MKVLVVTNLFPPEFLGGYELGCGQMVEALRGMGHEVRVMTSASSCRPPDDPADNRRVLELSPIYNPARTQTGDAALAEHFQLIACAVSLPNLRAIDEAIESFQPDVAYLWNLMGLGGLGIVGLMRERELPWVWHIMDIVPRLLCGIGGDAIPHLAEEFGRIARGRYIACSTHVVQENRDGGIDMGDHINVLPNWIAGARPEPRLRFFAGGELRMMTAVGVMGEHKGTHILIETAARLHDAGFANFSIDIYGREGEPRFRRELYERDVVGTVRFMGSLPQPELLKLYADYDVFAFPTWAREPSAFAPLEAAAHGCVPLFSDDCGNAEWLINEVDCLKARRDPASFADRIAQVLTGQVDLGAIGRRAQAAASREFHLDRIAPQVESILGEAAVERPAELPPASSFHKLATFADGLLPALLAERRF